MATAERPGRGKQKKRGIKMPENLVIDIQKLKYESKNPIGAGGFGKVYSVIHKDWDLRLAVKKLGVNGVDEGLPITTKLKKEALFLKDLRHPNIIELSGVLWKEPDFGIVMPLVPHGSLDTFNYKYKPSWLIKTDFIHQVCLGLAYLHTLQNPIIHGDLKLGNILVDNGCVMKLADFGLSSWREYQSTYSTRHGVQGTITHISPEMWENPEIQPQEPQDIYAMGILTWELFAAKRVYEGRNRDLIIHYVKSGKQPPADKMGSEPRELKKLVQSCWALEVNQRPSVLEIKSSLTEIAAPREKDIKRAKLQLLSALAESSDEEDTEESEDESDESEESEDERQRREQEERKEKDMTKEKKRQESKRSKAAATDDEELVASRFATHGSYLARDSGTVLHLCEVEGSEEDTVRAIRPAIAVWNSDTWPPPSPGVEVLVVGNSWKAVVGGLEAAESRGHKTVAVMAWGCYGDGDMRPLSDNAAARRAPAATDVWLLYHGTVEVDLSRWQQQLDADSRYQRIN